MPQDANGATPPSMLLDALATGVLTVDLGGVLTWANTQAETQLRRSRDDLVGQRAHELLHHTSRDGSPHPVERCPIRAVIRTGRSDRDDRDIFWLPDGSPLPVSWVAAPLVEDGVVLGSVVVFSDITEREQRILAASQRADELRQQRERLAADNDRLALLASLHELLATLDTDEGLSRLARFPVGRLADWSVVDAVDGASIRRVAVSHHDAATPTDRQHIGQLPPLTSRSTGSLARALRTGQPQLVTLEAADREAGSAGKDPLDREQHQLLTDLQAAHVLVLPLTARDQTLGAMTWARVDPMAPFDDNDLLLAVEVARRAGLTLDNARLFGQQRSAAEILQRGMLSPLPEPDHLHLAARYLPAAAGTEIGGDWYDAFVMPGGATMVSLGDIVGHDLAAATKMGQVRSLLRGIAVDREEPPGEVMRRLDITMDRLALATLATAVVARITQTPDQQQAGVRMFEWTNAGHPPPMVVAADGGVRMLEAESDLLLGVEPYADRGTHVETLGPSDTVWIYTDGLVERSDQPLDHGLTRLRRALRSTAGQPLETACDAVLAAMLPDSHPDDVALIAVRAYPQTEPRPADAGRAHL